MQNEPETDDGIETNASTVDKFNPLKTVLIVFIPSIVVVVIILIVIFNSGEEKKESDVSAALVQGKEYLVFVRSVQAYPHKSNGDSWDIDSSAPEIFHRIYWNNNLIHTSTTQTDVLIARWATLGADAWRIIRNGGKMNVVDAIQGGTIRYKKGGELYVKIIDADLIENDTIAYFFLRLDNMKQGMNEYGLFKSSFGGFEQLTVQIVDASLPYDELLTCLSATK
ncbi:MAG: hypothetical protein HOC27_01455 [Phycisphaerae bacterium]|nr:hypothetical protein [Phycisphaerae bacterium]